MSYPVKVKMRPGLTRLGGKLYAMGGCLIPVPDGTTLENLHEYVIYDPEAEARHEIKDRWVVERCCYCSLCSQRAISGAMSPFHLPSMYGRTLRKQQGRNLKRL